MIDYSTMPAGPEFDAVIHAAYFTREDGSIFVKPRKWSTRATAALWLLMNVQERYFCRASMEWLPHTLTHVVQLTYDPSLHRLPDANDLWEFRPWRAFGHGLTLPLAVCRAAMHTRDDDDGEGDDEELSDASLLRHIHRVLSPLPC